MAIKNVASQNQQKEEEKKNNNLDRFIQWKWNRSKNIELV